MGSSVGDLVQKRMRRLSVSGRELARRTGCTEGAVRHLISGAQRTGRFRGLRVVQGREPLLLRIQRALEIPERALRTALARDDARARDGVLGSRRHLSDPLLRTQRAAIVAAASRHGAWNVRAFGSRARGDARPDSDVDLLVTFEQGRSLIDLSGLILDLRDLLSCDVDVATERGLHPAIRDRILREAVSL